MTPPTTLAPPPPPAARAARPRPPPRVPLRRPFPRPPRLASPRNIALSALLHLTAIAALVLLRDERLPVSVPTPPPEQVTLVDIGAFPGTGAAPLAAGTAGEVRSPPLLPAPPSASAATAASPSATAPSRAAPAGRGAAAAARPGGVPSGALRGDAGAGAGGAAPEGTGEGSALRPGWRDPRLIPGAPEDVSAERPMTEHEQYMAHLRSRIDVYNDSVASGAERARRATDWTVKGKNGERWGVSPGKVHLGKLTLPSPLPSFRPPAMQEEGAAAEAAQRREIDRQAQDGARDAALKEQKRSAREHADEKRRRESEPDGG